MTAPAETGHGTAAGSSVSRDACAASPLPLTASTRTTLSVLIVSFSLLQGCATSPPPSPNSATAAGTLAHDRADAEGWPCDRSALTSRHCRLLAAEGFVPAHAPASTTFADMKAEAALTASIIAGSADAVVELGQLKQAWQMKLSPAVTWQQDPQSPAGFEVQGISGSERLPMTADPAQMPRHFHIVSYRNPKTGSVLLLEASAPEANWQQVWQRLAPVFAGVRLSEDF